MTRIGCRWLATAAVALLWLGMASDSGLAEGASDAQEGVETENLFGFTNGSDTGEAGSKEFSPEAAMALGKRAEATARSARNSSSASGSPTISAFR